MGQVLHGSTTTTEAVRRAIQNSQEPEGAGQALRDQPEDRSQVAQSPFGRRSSDRPERTVVHSSAADEEVIIVAFRRHTLLPLDDCLYAPQATIPQPKVGCPLPNIGASGNPRMIHYPFIARSGSGASFPRNSCARWRAPPRFNGGHASGS
jgi:plasmid stabilization system protein ParE